jgi:hypothetical protein
MNCITQTKLQLYVNRWLTGKRYGRKEKERILVMMRFANLRENRDSGKRLGSRISLHLKFPVYYPPLGVTPVRIKLPIGQGAYTKGKCSTYL